MGRIDLPDVPRDEDEPQTSFANYAALPVFDNAKDGLSFLDEQEEKARLELEAEAKRRMDAAQEDPSAQSYFMRMDKKTVVKDEREYQHCLGNRVPMKVIPYGHALQLLKEEEARDNHRLKAKAKRKAAKKARKRNRK